MADGKQIIAALSLGGLAVDAQGRHSINPSNMGSPLSTMALSDYLLVWVSSAPKVISVTSLATVLLAETVEAKIATGTAAQYIKGNKTLGTLNQAAVAGLTTTDSPTFASMTISHDSGKIRLASLSNPAYYYEFDRYGHENISATTTKLIQFGGVTKFTFNSTGILDLSGITVGTNAFVDSSRNLTATTATIGSGKEWGKQAVAPSAGVGEGHMYSNTTDHHRYYHNGTSFVQLDNAA